ncbi:MAG: Hpt protein [Edaphobacter sp.]|jgi:HPt (histidine-containing phosphotransfer) domain-containing protein|nr:Hpt protein [Edaphobacter sp.]
MTDNANDEIADLLANLWQRHLPTMYERLAILDRAAAAASANTLGEPAREEALSVAHKLSGNLGMFGYQQAGNIASEIEQIFRAPTPRKLARLTALTARLRKTLAPML